MKKTISFGLHKDKRGEFIGGKDKDGKYYRISPYLYHRPNINCLVPILAPLNNKMNLLEPLFGKNFFEFSTSDDEADHIGYYISEQLCYWALWRKKSITLEIELDN